MSNIARKLISVASGITPGVPPDIIGAKSTTLAQGASLTSVSHEPGDYIIFVNGNDGGFSQVSPPPLTSGYTNLVQSPVWFRTFRVQYKVATTSGTETVVSDDFGLLIIVRNAMSVGQSAYLQPFAFSATLGIPNLSGLDTTSSLVLAGSFNPRTTTTDDFSSVTSPFALKESVANNTNTIFSYAAIENNTSTSYSGKTLSLPSGEYTGTWAIELIGA